MPATGGKTFILNWYLALQANRTYFYEKVLLGGISWGKCIHIHTFRLNIYIIEFGTSWILLLYMKISCRIYKDLKNCISTLIGFNFVQRHIQNMLTQTLCKQFFLHSFGEAIFRFTCCYRICKHFDSKYFFLTDFSFHES